MDTKSKIKNLLIVLFIAIFTVLFFNYVIKVNTAVLGIIGSFIVVMMPGVLSFLSSNKTNNIVLNMQKDHITMKNGMLEISESFKHKKEIVKLCQTIENETSGIFEGYSEVNTMLRDYIIGVNEVISMIIEKQYEYDFDEFDSKYFKTKILNKVSQLTEHINYVMIDKNTFEKINDKVIQNIRGYITELKYVKGLENGERRKEFKDLTLKLTKKITNHSIDIYNKKVTA